MDKLGWICLSLVSLSGPLWALPVVSSSESLYWLPEGEEDSRLTLEALNSKNTGSLQQTPARLLGIQTDEHQHKTGLSPSNFNSRKSVKEAPFGNLSQNMLLSRLLATNRKQYKKRGNLSECFWKYCV